MDNFRNQALLKLCSLSIPFYGHKLKVGIKNSIHTVYKKKHVRYKIYRKISENIDKTTVMLSLFIVHVTGKTFL